MPITRTATAALSAALLLAGCGSAAEDGAADGAGLSIVAAFYPLQFVAERVADDRATVSNLTPPGVESHDLEITPSQVGALTGADLAVYLAGYQPAVDSAIGAEAADAGFDVTPAARLTIPAASHDDDSSDAADGGTADPHFWLDPLRLADVGDAVADELARIDPDGADTYAANAAALRADLEGLHADFRSGTATCANRFLVVSHAAFAYLAEAYDFHQEGIAGVSADSEPSPADLAELTRFVEENKVNTVYTEVLVSPAIAETLAAEANVSTGVLDPIEGLTQDSAADDYLGLMRANLAAVRAGQPCR